MINRLIRYIKDSKVELQKVVWPTRKILIKHTFAVIAFSLVIAFFLGIIDFGLTKAVELLI